MPLSRISITIPGELVRRADRRAKELDRSRSWLLVEALRQYLARSTDAPTTAVREGGPADSGLGESRLAQLEADLALTPEERVLAAESTARVAELRGRRPQRDRVIGFERFEDFRAWEVRDELAR